MDAKLIYVELSTGFNHNGPAWIGKADYSRSKQTIYFNGKALKKMSGDVASNYFDMETGDKYWISGIKKSGQDRHWAGSGKIMIDKDVIDEYLQYTGKNNLDKSKFEVVDLDKSNIKDRIKELENEKIE